MNMKNFPKIILLGGLVMMSSCSSQRQLLQSIQQDVKQLSTKEQVLALTKSFTVLDSTIRATNVNVLNYEISKTRMAYDSLSTSDAVLKRAKEVLERIKKGGSLYPP